MLVIIFSVVFALMTGFGIVTLVLGVMLHGSNNIGDDKSAPFHYSYAVTPRFTMSREDCTKEECEEAAKRFKVSFDEDRYAPSDNDPVKAFDPAAVKVAPKPGPVLDDQYDIDGDLPSVDKPLFKPKD